MRQPPLREWQTQGVGVLFTLPLTFPANLPRVAWNITPITPHHPKKPPVFAVYVLFGGYFELTSCHLEANFPPLTFTTSNLSPPALRFLLARNQ